MYVRESVCKGRKRVNGVDMPALAHIRPHPNPTPPPRAGDDHSLLRLCCDLYGRTGKAWLFEMEAVAVILKYKW